MATRTSLALPKVVAFDLDGTLWAPEMYELWGGGAPFTKHHTQKHVLVDRAGVHVRLLGISGQVLEEIAQDPRWKETGTYFALASTCDEPSWARECLTKFMVDDGRGGEIAMGDLFQFHEIYKAHSKANHFQQIMQKATSAEAKQKVPFEDMIFFDNQMNNIRDVSKLGVYCVYCPDGVTEDVWLKSLDGWRKHKFEKTKKM
eukprot:PhM_4_TR7509/c0_g1_i2/m.84503/K17619/MDP1; magnesium-dependent phosphatase 1